ncbi:MAG TPA: cation diffusion facilitator family transporter [Solirubrobacteraceae bacterium]|nr:cation diffusion facilitator family transporter [Solirubrobacteraceae bacterium]
MSRVHERGPAISAQQTTIVSVGVAAALVALKLGVGLGTHSLGLVSAGIESSGDVVAAGLTVFVVRLAGRPADRGHPYGHRRAENLGALGEAGILLAGAVVVTVEGLRHLIVGGSTTDIRWFQFAILGVAIALDLSRTLVSRRGASLFESPALRSNAWHFGADLLGSVAVVAGLLAVKWGWDDGDAVAALVVAAVMLVASARLAGTNANALMDRAPVEARAAAEEAIAELSEDFELSRLRLRESAGRYFADVVVSVPPGQAVVEGHRAADLIEGAVERALPGSDVVVHVEPRRRGLDLRERVLAIALAEPLVKEAHDITIFEHEGNTSVSLHLKFPPELDLQEAHDAAERIEQAIRELPGVGEVQTHLEPLERPLSGRSADGDGDGGRGQQIQGLVRELTGSEPRLLELISTEVGLVLFLTLNVGVGESLTDAHRLASELEDELRSRVEGIAEVVVHTEP